MRRCLCITKCQFILTAAKKFSKWWVHTEKFSEYFIWWTEYKIETKVFVIMSSWSMVTFVVPKQTILSILIVDASLSLCKFTCLYVFKKKGKKKISKTDRFAIECVTKVKTQNSYSLAEFDKFIAESGVFHFVHLFFSCQVSIQLCIQLVYDRCVSVCHFKSALKLVKT